MLVFAAAGARCPLVYKPFGHFSDPESLVVIEDEVFDYLSGNTRDKDPIPAPVRSALSDTALLVLGFHVDDWHFRSFFRSTMSQEGGGRRSRHAHLAVHHLLIAGRVVLLYSPSGAGKSPLIQAGLAPALERKGVAILPTIRVNLLPPAGVAANSYLYSTLAALAEGRPAGERLPAEQRAAPGLQQYLDLWARAEGDIVLIFDQFEELLTASPATWRPSRRAKASLGAALERRRFWALVALRKDTGTRLRPRSLVVLLRCSTLPLLLPLARQMV